MSKAIRLEDEAGAELNDAARWYEERQSGLGQRYLENVHSTFRQLLQYPSFTIDNVRAIGSSASDHQRAPG